MYTLQEDGSMQQGEAFKADKARDADGGESCKRSSSLPCAPSRFPGDTATASTRAQARQPRRRGTLAESYPTSRMIVAPLSRRASYGAKQVGVNPVGE